MQPQNARIAQLVEHDLAKVGVADSSSVSRSKNAQVAELVDALDLKSSDHYGRAGSSPALGTKTPCNAYVARSFRFLGVANKGQYPDQDENYPLFYYNNNKFLPLFYYILLIFYPYFCYKKLCICFIEQQLIT